MPPLPNNEVTDADKVEVTYLFVLFLLAILVYFPLIGTGFTTNDDLLISNGVGTTSVWSSGLFAAVAQGRIGFFVGVPLLQTPYFFDSAGYFNLVRLGSSIIMLVLLFLLIRKVFKNFSIAVLTIAYFLAFIQNGWEQNLLTSYPAAFNIQFAAFLAAVLAFCVGLEKKSKSWGFLSAGLYGVTLANESFFLYGAVFFAIALFDSRSQLDKASTNEVLKSTFKKLIPIAGVGALYLAAYAVWRYNHPSTYDGNTVNLSEPNQVLKVLWTFSTSAFPGYKFFNREWQYTSLVTSYAPAAYEFRTVVAEMRVEWIVKALIVAVLTVAVLVPRPSSSMSMKRLLAVMALSLVCMFLPNVLVSLTAVYRAWLRAGSTSYHYTYYSFIAVVVFLAALSIFLMNLLVHRPKLRWGIICLIAVLSTTWSVTTDFHNYFVVKDQKLSHKKWTVVDQFLKTEVFINMPQGATIYAPSLYVHRNIVAIHSNYWTDYIFRKTGKKILVVEKPNEISAISTAPIFYLKLLQDAEGINQMLLLAQVDNPTKLKDLSRIASKETVIFSYSRARSVFLTGHAIQGETNGLVKIGGKTVTESSGTSFSKLIRFNDVSTFPSVTVSSDNYFDPDNFAFSYFADSLQLSPVSIDVGDSFYSWEKVGNQDSQSWSRGDATLIATNLGQSPIKALVSMRLTTLVAREVSIAMNDSSKTIQLAPGKWVNAELQVTLQPGKSAVKMTTTSPPQSPGGADRRQLAFLVSTLAIAPAGQKPASN